MMDLYEMFSNMPMFKNFEKDEIKELLISRLDRMNELISDVER